MYFYPDYKDKNTNKTINKNIPYKGYWEKSEKYVLKIIKNHLNNTFIENTLDIGAGEGRLIKYLCNISANVSCIEPDKIRFKKCKQKAKQFKNVKLYNTTFNSFKAHKNTYNLIFTSHLLQHISTEDSIHFLNKAHRLLKPGGILVILTSHSQNNYDKFITVYTSNNKLVEKQTSKEQYNNYIINPHNITPLRLFSIKTIKKYLKKYAILKVSVFHIMHNPNFIDKFIFRDKFYNLPFLKNKHGRDILIIAKKK